MVTPPPLAPDNFDDFYVSSCRRFHVCIAVRTWRVTCISIFESMLREVSCHSAVIYQRMNLIHGVRCYFLYSVFLH